MKKAILVCFFSFYLFNAQSQVLFSYGNHQVTVSEFLKAFYKNKTDSSDNARAMRDYLDLFINFKLKEQAAQDMRLDTSPSMKADVQNFRLQIQNRYLTDQDETNFLTKQAFDRSQKDIHTVYYFLQSAGADSAESAKAIKRIASEIKGNSKGAVLAELKSSGLFKISSVDLGYITVFSLPYSLENVIYSLHAGEISEPFPAKKGWYIFQDVDERKAVGKITVAQILFAIPQDAASALEGVKKLADSVYEAFKSGSDFSTLAKQFSDDRSTYMNGGLMQEFGTSKYDSVFENHAFALKNDGEISEPFQTSFGYHILKRMSAEPVPSSENDETFINELKQKVLQDSRSELAKEKFITKILPLVGLKRKKIDQKDLFAVSDTLTKNKDFKTGSINFKTILFTFSNGAKITVGDWITYFQNHRPDENSDTSRYVERIFQRFIDESAVENYAARLEEFDPAFKSEVEEFEEGNMLFDAMQKEVWQKGTEDSVGLKNFYANHQEKYVWNRSADAVIFSCSTLDIANKCIAELRRKKTWREVADRYPDEVHTDSSRFDLGQIPVVDRTNFTEGMITLPVVNKQDGSAVFAKIIKIYPANEPRQFDDARGLVVNDYQNYLEEKWIQQLKKKYPVKIDDSVFQSLINKTYR